MLFSESQSRLLVTVAPDHAEEFEKLFSGQDICCLGKVSGAQILKISGKDGTIIIEDDIYALKEAWQATLKEL
jgi:phosphoribosylformylglycinamidine synthase